MRRRGCSWFIVVRLCLMFWKGGSLATAEGGGNGGVRTLPRNHWDVVGEWLRRWFGGYDIARM